MTDEQTVITENTEATGNNEVTATAEPITVAVQNPTPEEMKGLIESIKVNYAFDVTVRDTKFNFKKTKDKDTGVELIREPVVLAVPYPSVNGVLKILEDGGKGLELLLEAMETVVNSAARDILSDGQEGMTLNAATFPVDKLAWEVIANIPKTQRRGGGIPKETWEEFGTDYLEVMPTATGKTVEQIATASKILQSKLAGVKTNAPVLELLVGQLAIYMEHSPKATDYQECVEFLLAKAETFLNVSPEELLANL